MSQIQKTNCEAVFFLNIFSEPVFELRTSVMLKLIFFQERHHFLNFCFVNILSCLQILNGTEDFKFGP